MKHLLISILFFSLFLTSCEKGFDYDCTDCTFFVCNVNGEEWQPQCSGTIGFGCSARDARYANFGTMNIYIFITNENRNEGLRINSTKVDKNNEAYPLMVNESFITSFYSGLGDCRQFKINPAENDSLFITEIDTINFLIAGTFAFTGYNDCGDKVEVTNGKFRLNYTF